MVTGSVAPPKTHVLVIEHGREAGIGRFGEWLPRAGAEVRVVRPYAGEVVPDAVEHGGLVVLGGEQGAYDDDRAPWLPATRDLLKRAAADQVPTLGICLGAQLLAAACGGRVERGGHGPEVGAHRVRFEPAAADDLLLAGLGETAYAVQWHDDAITELPPGAALLAHGDTYPHQAFRLGERAWGVQFHPEAGTAAVTSWAHHDGERVRTYGIDPAAAVADVAARSTEIARMGQRLAERFVELSRGR